MHRKASLSRAVEEGTEIIEKSSIDEYFEPVTKAMSFYLYNVDRGPGNSKLNRLGEVVQLYAIVSACYYIVYSIYNLCIYDMTELTVLLFFTIICIFVNSVSGSIIMYNWQKRGTIKRLFRLLHLANEGKGVKRHSESIVSLNRIMRWFRNFTMIYTLSFLFYFAFGPTPYGIDYDLLVKILYFERLFPIYNLTCTYLLVGWCIQVHIYCYCIRVTTCEVNNFIQEAIEVRCTTEAEAIAFFTDSIRRNARLSIAVGYLDEMLKRYSFFEMSMIIPCVIFFAFATIMRRHAPLAEFVPSLILVVICLGRFYIITMYPARLHNQMKKTRALFSNNIRQWIPFGQSVHTAALVLSSHLEQNDLGVSIWGFALLTKPLILTALSAMTTALAIFLQFSDCQKQMDAEFQNVTRTT